MDRQTRSSSVTPRTFKLLVFAQIAAIAIVSTGFFFLRLEDYIGPLGKGGKNALLQRLCRDSSLSQGLHKKFHNTVLIINTNYETVAWSTSQFLRSVYGRYFDNVVIISEKNIPELGVEVRNHHKWRGKWYYAFWHLPKVIADFPDADGYLWTNDDVALNYWKLLDANMSKLWLTNDPKHPESRFFPFDLTTRAKWSDWAAEAETRKRASDAYINMDEGYRRQFDHSVMPNQGTFPKRIVDLFFIPRRFAKKLSFDLIPIYRESRLWSEVAIPMMFYALDSPRNWDHVLDDMKYSWGHWDKSRVFDPSEHWNPNISAFHPWKLSNPVQRTQLIMAFSNVDPCVLQLLSEKSISRVELQPKGQTLPVKGSM